MIDAFKRPAPQPGRIPVKPPGKSRVTCTGIHPARQTSNRLIPGKEKEQKSFDKYIAQGIVKRYASSLAPCRLSIVGTYIL